MAIDYNSFPGRDKLGDRIVREVRYTAPAAYVAGGDGDVVNDLGLSQIYGVYGTITNGTAVLITSWDFTAQKLKVLVPNTGAEASGNLSAYVGTLLFTGK